MTAHNFLHIVIVVGGVSDGFLPNGLLYTVKFSKIVPFVVTLPGGGGG